MSDHSRSLRERNVIDIHNRNLRLNQDLIEEVFNFSNRMYLVEGEKLYRLNKVVKDSDIEDLIKLVRDYIELIDQDIYVFASHDPYALSRVAQLENIKRQYKQQLDFLERRYRPLRHYPSMTPKNFAQRKKKSRKRTKRTRTRTRLS